MIKELSLRLKGRRVSLLLGSGASLDSGAPRVDELTEAIAELCGCTGDGVSLKDIATLAETKFSSRKAVVARIRDLISKSSPTGAIHNLPKLKLGAIFTTNYDELVEQTYRSAGKKLKVISSDFDYSSQRDDADLTLYKVHGTVSQDRCDGHRSSMIISHSDYSDHDTYRKSLLNTFRHELSTSEVVIVGYSLSDEHIKSLLDDHIRISGSSGADARIHYVSYQKNELRKEILESQGFKVYYGDLADVVGSLEYAEDDSQIELVAGPNIVDTFSSLSVSTVNIAHSIEHLPDSFSAMFAGNPASVSDVREGHTFYRDNTPKIVNSVKNGRSVLISGASGVGKTSAAHQALYELTREGFVCWSHKKDKPLAVDDWLQVAKELTAASKTGVLFIDDANLHIGEVNNLVEDCYGAGLAGLRFICTSTKSSWAPLIKSPIFATEFDSVVLRKLSGQEIDRLIDLIDTNPKIRSSIEHVFSGFSRGQKKKRLERRCEADMFVCLKNIFGSRKFDRIILDEFDAMERSARDVYKLVSCLESAGVRVHRQLVLRMTNLGANEISNALGSLEDIVFEYSIDEENGIFGWRGRHSAISQIIRANRLGSNAEFVRLVDRVLDQLAPSYYIERQSLVDLCNFDGGILTISKASERNRLLRKMISIAPGERVPRHRLIRSLISDGALDEADFELRVYEREIKKDGAWWRYSIELGQKEIELSSGNAAEKLRLSKSLMQKAADGISKYQNNKYVCRSFGEAALQKFTLDGDYEAFDDAIGLLRLAKMRIGDDDFSRYVSKLERAPSRFSS